MAVGKEPLDHCIPGSNYRADDFRCLTCDGYNTNVARLNAKIWTLPPSRPSGHIVIVNQHDALDYSCDGSACNLSPQQNLSGNIVYIHPNQIGYSKMADTWLQQSLKSNKLVKCDYARSRRQRNMSFAHLRVGGLDAVQWLTAINLNRT